MNRMKNLFTLLTLLLWTLVACSNDSAADEKPGSGGTDIPAGNLPMQNVARAIELIDNAVECYFTAIRTRGILSATPLYPHGRSQAG